MFFIGIVTNQKNELYMKKEISKFIPKENILFINEKNISNMKNVQFETVIIDSKINNISELRKIVANSKYLLLNADIDINREVINNLNLTVITYGFNNKATFTVSSMEEKTIIIWLQRIIYTKARGKIEPQEYEVKIDGGIDKDAIMASNTLKILYEKI